MGCCGFLNPQQESAAPHKCPQVNENRSGCVIDESLDVQWKCFTELLPCVSNLVNHALLPERCDVVNVRLVGILVLSELGTAGRGGRRWAKERWVRKRSALARSSVSSQKNKKHNTMKKTQRVKVQITQKAVPQPLQLCRTAAGLYRCGKDACA